MEIKNKIKKKNPEERNQKELVTHHESVTHLKYCYHGTRISDRKKGLKGLRRTGEKNPV